MRKLIASLLVVVCGLLISAIVTEGADDKKPAETKPIEPEAVKLGRPVDFTRDILPILDANCVACHNIAIDEGKFVLEDVESIFKGGKRGAAVVPKQPEKSLIYLAAARAKKPAMPPLPNQVDAVALTPKQLGLLRQWILEGATKGSGTQTETVNWRPLPAGMNAIYSVAISPWGNLAAAGRANQISVYDLLSAREIARLRDPNLSEIDFEDKPMYPGGAAHRDFVNSLAFSSDGTIIASGGYRVVKLWKRSSEVRKHQFSSAAPVSAVAVSADGKWAAIGSQDNSIKLWNLMDGKPGETLNGHSEPVTGLHFWPTTTEKMQTDNQVLSAVSNVRSAQEKLGSALETAEKFDPKQQDKKLTAEQIKAKQDQVIAAKTAAEKALETAKAALKSALQAQAALDKKIAEEGTLFSVSADKTIRVWKVADGSPAGQLQTPAAINDVIVNKQATQIVTAEADNTIRVWAYPFVKPEPADGDKKQDEGKDNDDPAVIKPLRELTGHSQPVTSLALLLPAGAQVVSGSEDGSVRIWDLNNGKQIRSMNHGGPVADVAARPDGAKIVSVGTNNVGKLWTAKDGKQEVEFKGNVRAQRRLIDWTEEQSVAKQQVSTADAAQKASDKNLKDRTAAAKKAKEAKAAAEKALSEAKSKSDAGTKKVADAAAAIKAAAEAAAKAKQDRETAVKQITENTAKVKPVTAVKDAAAKKSAAAATVQKAAAERKAKSDKLAADTAAAAQTTATAAAEVGKAAAAEPDHKDLKDLLTKAQKAAEATAAVAKKTAEFKAAADKEFASVDSEAKKTAKALAVAVKGLADVQAAIQASQQAQKKAEADLKAAGEKSKATAKAKADADKALKALVDTVKKATNSQVQAGRSLELASKAIQTAKQKDEQAKQQKAKEQADQKQVDEKVKKVTEEQKTFEKPIRSVAFSADGKQFVTGGDDNLLHLWDGNTGKQLDVFDGHAAPIGALAFGLNHVVVTGSEDKSAASWSVNPEWKLIGQLGPSKDAPLDLGSSPFVNRVLALDFSRDGKLLATGGGDPSRTGELMIWDVEKQELVRTIEDAHSDTILGLQFSRDGKMIVSGATDKFVKTFDVGTGKHIRSFEGHTHHVLDVSWKADGTSIVSAGADNVIKVWNVLTGEQRRTIGSHGKQVTSLHYIGAGDRFISCAGDKTVRLFTASNGKNERTFSGGTDFMYSAACARDESIVIGGGQDGVLRVWNGKNGQSLATFSPPPIVEAEKIIASADTGP